VLAQGGAARKASGRGLVLLPAGALAVHQLRYTLAYGSQASNELAVQGHAYLGSLVPWIVALVAAGLGCFVARLARAWQRGSDDSRRRPLFRLWATTGMGLVAIYALQELLEGLLAQGHPPGLEGIFGHGGWWSVPVAAAVALAIATLLRIGRTLVQLAAHASGRTRRDRTAIAVARERASTRTVALSPLAYAAAGRAPPASLAG
jgi:uncharacterized membrane protein